MKMKKIKLLFPFFIIALYSFSQDISFETKFSEPLAVYQFLNSLSSKAGSNPYKKLFTASKFNTKEYLDRITQFDSINKNYGYEFAEYPAGQKIGGYSESFLKRNLVFSNDAQDFKLRSMGLLPNSSLMKIASLINEFTPVYRAVIYEPNQQHFEDQIKGMSDLITSTNLNHYFGQTLEFFNAAWDNSVPFVFCFYPLPNSKRFSATAISNVAISPIPDTLDNYKSLLSVMLHEISHILYDEKPLSLWKQVDSWFNLNPSKVSKYAYWLFNEAMATSVANGYLYTQLNGKENPGAWYGVKYINLMAKEIYPLVKQYISDHKSIDQNFVNEYIRLYEEHFSVWLTEIENLMYGRSVLTENKADLDLIARLYRSPGNDYQSEINQASIDKLKNDAGTKMIIVNSDNKNKLNLIKENFSELKNWKYDAKKDFTYSIFLADKTYLMVLNNIHISTEEKLKTIVINKP